MAEENDDPKCIICGSAFALARRALKYETCMPCGEVASKQVVRTVANLHKSNYMMITDLADLRGLNNKGGLVK